MPTSRPFGVAPGEQTGGSILEREEWTVIGPDGENVEFVRASSQKEAWSRAAERGVVADHTNMVRPRTGDADLMSIEEFEDFLEENTR